MSNDFNEFLTLVNKGKLQNEGTIETYAEWIARLEKASCHRVATLVRKCSEGKIDVHELCDRAGFGQDIRSRAVRLDRRERRRALKNE